jgi:Cytochrome c554 and c-prime
MPMKVISFFAVAAALCCASPLVAQERSTTANPLWHDATKIVLPTRCAECHRKEYVVWEETGHARGSLVNRSADDAGGIKERMGVVSMKHESLCVKCHYTGVMDESSGRPVGAAGVSCESCHGAARDWINTHNNYGAGNTRDTEPPQHKEQRLAESRTAGMLLPDDLYSVVANCYQCHTIPQEQLVNIGQHTAGSTSFEVVEKFDQLRHNFLHSSFEAGKTENAEIPPGRRRLMYVVGLAVDLEYSLRGVAEATDGGGRYLRAMQRRVYNARNKLAGVTDRVSVPEVTVMIALVKDLPLEPGQREQVLTVAEKVKKLNNDLIRNHAANGFAGVDSLLTR